MADTQVCRALYGRTTVAKYRYLHEGIPRPAPNICCVVMEHQNFQARYEGSIPSTRFVDDLQDYPATSPADRIHKSPRNGRNTDAPAAVAWPTIVLVVVLLTSIWLLTEPDSAIPYESTATQQRRVYAIRKTFGPKYAAAAIRVARCESGINPHAVNGQYRGAFQMGKHERKTYGHGSGVWQQARAARRYFNATGRDWSPWDCKP